MTPKYERLAGFLREEIKEYIKEGSGKLPTEAQLCDSFKVSRQTVRQALDILIEEGLIERRQGSGTFIRKTLITKRSSKIALLVPTASEYTFPALISDIKSFLAAKGFELDIYVTDNKVSLERNILLSLIESLISGIMLVPVHSSLPAANIDLFDRFSDINVPIIFIEGNYSNCDRYISIRSDDLSGSYIAARHLIEQGHTNISCILRSDDISGPDKYAGICNALTDSHISPEDNNFFWYTYKELTGLRLKEDRSFLKDFADTRLNGRTAIICNDDEIAYFLIKELTDRGLEIPKDYSVISFDNSYLASFGPVYITSLDLGEKALSHEAARCMLSLLDGQAAASVKLSWHISDRQSTASIEALHHFGTHGE